MTRARIALLSSLSLLVAGGVFALAALTAEKKPEPLLPPEAVVLPPDAAFMMAIDVERLVASPFYAKVWAKAPQPSVWTDLEELSGVRPERDLRRLIIAGDAKPTGHAVALVLGRFQRDTVERSLAKTSRLTKQEYKKRRIWTTEPKPGEKVAFTFLSDGVLISGPPEPVKAAIDRYETGGTFTPRVTLQPLLAQVGPASTFWIVGDESLLATATGMAAPAAGGWSLPALKSLVVTGDLGPSLSALILGETVDEGAAKNVAGMLQGLIAIFSMQSSQRPELRDLISGLEVGSEGPRVRVKANVSYETLEKLMPRPTSPPPAAASPSPAARARP
jgi:hypothetical protein